MQKAETTIVANVVVNLIGVRLMRLIDADQDYAYLNTANAIDKAIEIVKRGGREC